MRQGYHILGWSKSFGKKSASKKNGYVTPVSAGSVARDTRRVHVDGWYHDATIVARKGTRRVHVEGG